MAALDNQAPDDDLCAWPVAKRTLVWAEITHDGERHRVPFYIEQGTLLLGHPNMLRKAGAIQPQPPAQVVLPQAEGGEKPQQAVTPKSTAGGDGHQ